MNISAPGIIREKPSYGESQEEVEKKKRVFFPGFPRSLVLRVWSLEMATLASRGDQSHSRSTESETLRVKPSNMCFNKFFR